MLESPPSPPLNPVSAGAPLRIAAEEGPVDIAFSAVQAYHGHAALAMLALTYQGLRGALLRLETQGQPVNRKDLTVISGHPGPGVRDAFEFVTRAVTRGCYTVDLALPWARYGLANDKSYSFLLRHGTRQVRGVLRADVLPARFFELQASASPEASRAFSALRRQIAATVTGQEPDALFEYELTAAASA